MPKTRSSITIHWFRCDLRLADNPALSVAAKEGEVLPIYIHTAPSHPHQQPGAASRWWLHQSLIDLNEQLDGRLRFFQGDAKQIFSMLCYQFNVQQVCFNNSFDLWQQQEDDQIEQQLTTKRIKVYRTNGSLLWQPQDCLKKDGQPYRVFTPFFRNTVNNPPPRYPLPKPEKLVTIPDPIPESCKLEELNLKPHHPWAHKLSNNWTTGEQAAHQRLNSFLDTNMQGYREGRDFPAKASTSRLSSALHFGELSPNQLWYAAENHPATDDALAFRRQLAWREFCYNQWTNNPEMGHKNLQSKFDRFAWHDNPSWLQRWQQGHTGYPIVDAGMRELWQTGTMHNRVRMIVASFLVKNLRIHWRHGERWFRDCLVDADCALNSANWQWVAGCGMDAAPYFRIFNPTTQAKKFDPSGAYIRSFVPELAALTLRDLHTPWLASDATLKNHGIVISENYPFPIVDLKVSRQNALTAYHQLKDPTHLSF